MTVHIAVGMCFILCKMFQSFFLLKEIIPFLLLIRFYQLKIADPIAKNEKKLYEQNGEKINLMEKVNFNWNNLIDSGRVI